MGLAVADFFGTALGADVASFLPLSLDFLDFLPDDFFGLASLPDEEAVDALLLLVTAPLFLPAWALLAPVAFLDFWGDSFPEVAVEEAEERLRLDRLEP